MPAYVNNAPQALIDLMGDDVGSGDGSIDGVTIKLKPAFKQSL